MRDQRNSEGANVEACPTLRYIQIGATMTHYTGSTGERIEIANMPFPHLVSAHKKAVATEERKHHSAFINGTTYENKEREAEIDAMAAEIAKRDEAYSAEQADVQQS